MSVTRLKGNSARLLRTPPYTHNTNTQKKIPFQTCGSHDLRKSCMCRTQHRLLPSSQSPSSRPPRLGEPPSGSVLRRSRSLSRTGVSRDLDYEVAHEPQASAHLGGAVVVSPRRSRLARGEPGVPRRRVLPAAQTPTPAPAPRKSGDPFLPSAIRRPRLALNSGPRPPLDHWAIAHFAGAGKSAF